MKAKTVDAKRKPRDKELKKFEKSFVQHKNISKLTQWITQMDDGNINANIAVTKRIVRLMCIYLALEEISPKGKDKPWKSAYTLMREAGLRTLKIKKGKK